MTRQEYTAELRRTLDTLPLSIGDVDDAVQFYEEYFEEAGPNREQDVIKELGSPAYVAAQIAIKLSNSATPLTKPASFVKASKSSAEKSPGLRKQASVLWTVILGVLAAPVALPLALGLAAAIFGLLTAAFALVFAFGASGIVCVAAGAATAFYSLVSVLAADFATGIYFIGVGLFTAGAGILLTKLGLWFGKLFIKIGGKVGARFFKKNAGTGRAPVVVPAMESNANGGGQHA